MTIIHHTYYESQNPKLFVLDLRHHARFMALVGLFGRLLAPPSPPVRS
jgi:hypothetical protein